MTTGAEFNEVAWAYDRNRPGYGTRVPKLIAEYALRGVPLDRPVNYLELGSGTGIATQAVIGATREALRRRGRSEDDYRITAIEPGVQMLAVAREKLAGDEGRVRFVQDRFDRVDDASIPEQPFGLVFVGTAWKWLTRDGWNERGMQERIHKLLRPAGWLAIMHNVQAVAGSGDRFYVESRQAWHDHLGEPMPAQPLPAISDLRPTESLYSDLFTPETFVADPRTDQFDVASYLGRISTYSPVIAMNPAQRGAFFADLTNLIEGQFGGEVETNYAVTLTIAQRT